MGEGRDKNDVRANMSKIDCERNKLKLQEKRCWEINRQRWEIRREGQRKEDNRKPKKKKNADTTVNSGPYQRVISKGLYRAICCQPGPGHAGRKVGGEWAGRGESGIRCIVSSGGRSPYKEAEPLLFLSKACSNQKIALYCFPYKITLFHMLSKAIKMLVAKLISYSVYRS